MQKGLEKHRVGDLAHGTHSTKLAEKPGFLRPERFAYSSGDRITLSAKSEEVMSLSQSSTAGVGLVFSTAFSKPEWPTYNSNAHEPNPLRHHLIPSEKAQDVWLQTDSHPFNERVPGQKRLQGSVLHPVKQKRLPSKLPERQHLDKERAQCLETRRAGVRSD